MADPNYSSPVTFANEYEATQVRPEAGVSARFYVESVLDERATNGWTDTVIDPATGMRMVAAYHPGRVRPVYRDAEFVEIRVPGSVTNIVCREIRPSDMDRFPRQYEAFKKGLTEPLKGIPLETAPFLTKSQIAELKYAGVHTVEDLASMNDSNGQQFMDYHKIKQRAIDYVAAVEGNAPAEKMRMELDKRDEEVAALKLMIQEIQAAQAAAAEPKHEPKKK